MTELPAKLCWCGHRKGIHRKRKARTGYWVRCADCPCEGYESRKVTNVYLPGDAP